MPDIGLYWIDDSIRAMMPIVSNVFPLVWNKDFFVKTILFGNEYCSKEDESHLTEEDRAAFETSIKKEFAYYCINMDNRNWVDAGTTYQEKSELIKKPLVGLIPLKDETESDGIEALIETWTNDARLKELKGQAEAGDADEALKEFERSVEALIKKMSFSEPAAVALDILLLYGDGPRLTNHLPIISMALYHFLQTKYTCYLYSMAGTSKAASDNWLDTYKSTFKPKDALPEIYPKNGLITRREDTPAKNELIKILDNLRKN